MSGHSDLIHRDKSSLWFSFFPPPAMWTLPTGVCWLDLWDARPRREPSSAPLPTPPPPAQPPGCRAPLLFPYCSCWSCSWKGIPLSPSLGGVVGDQSPLSLGSREVKHRSSPALSPATSRRVLLRNSVCRWRRAGGGGLSSWYPSSVALPSSQVGLLVLHWLELSPMSLWHGMQGHQLIVRRRRRWKRKWVWGRALEAWPALPAAWKALARISPWLVALWHSELSLNVTSSERLSLNSESKTAALTPSVTSLCFNSWNSKCLCEIFRCWLICISY